MRYQRNELRKGQELVSLSWREAYESEATPGSAPKKTF